MGNNVLEKGARSNFCDLTRGRVPIRSLAAPTLSTRIWRGAQIGRAQII